MGKIYEQLFELYSQRGKGDYIGEEISQMEHALQGAFFAREAGHSKEVVLATLLHDIGHILDYPLDEMEEMADLGILNHEKKGADYLRSLGLDEKVACLVEKHVEAKRYFTAKYPGYFEKLSHASLGTLQFQGGPMSDEEVLNFERHPLFKEILQLRSWDEKAKIQNLNVPPFSAYKDLL